ncbi:Ppx/GppA phosphatase family protein [Isoptericola dokdonensis]|jgi:exopolyphosphatase/guanosine-5'-triphosphate,3'-diphosphate pyrophosphatase|uniref:Guanosine-5'-triphosphate,3'-diphosphate pyrophosphatase n=1 Tax=Isoptericola dokdonensis DS-3 TaxID=1300344 RepID=A0A161IJP6_9MICO|nr:Ppx/GppA phosphatase family protein [Isoptericola dokdonensis]ANC32284.1 Guanosine-5'-triphosphate,3'-diphosphate pyrophosphatase [Isoptericola dokdonensis DS-3]
MRLGVIDIGSNTVHLLVMDARPGARPVPQASHKTTVRLMRYLRPDGAISPEGVAALCQAVEDAAAVGREHGVDGTMALATSAVREARNGAEVLAELERRAGVPIEVLGGSEEAELTFLAARRWYGWGAGRLLLLDIGGGSLEIATGLDESPDVALSVPLGAGRMTKEFLPDDPPRTQDVERLRKHVRTVLADAVGPVRSAPTPDHVVATSKTFRSLARLAGLPRQVLGTGERWRMRQDHLADWQPRLARLASSDRTVLPGIGVNRALQIVAGAVVAQEAMRALGVEEVEICPWALREGAILQRLDRL